MERRARAHGRPKPAALPTGVRIVDATVHPLRVEAEWIRNAEDDPLAVLEREQGLGRVAGVDRRVLAESQRVELIDPCEIARLGAARVSHTLELRQRLGVECPAFRTMLARRRWAVEWTLALAAIEAGHVPTRQRDPRDPVAINVHAPRREPAHGNVRIVIRRLIKLC